MKPIEFFAVGAKMREAQQKYYALPQYHPDKRKWLEEAKRLEKIFDAEVKRCLPLIDVALLKEAYSKYDKDYTPQMKLGL